MEKNEKDLRELGREYDKKLKELEKSIKKKYSQKELDLLGGNGLKPGGKKPSQFFEPILKKGWVSPELLPDCLACLDAVTNWQISTSYYRRAVRSSDYEVYGGRMSDIIRNFHFATLLKLDTLSIITHSFPEEIRAYLKYNYKTADSEYLIAAQIDRGNTAVKEYLLSQIFDEGGKLEMNQIHAIIMSGDKELWEALGKLLLAARLQEGLRQAICESMDVGRPDAFLYLFDIILENDLIRFSSVMRAAATWTGLLTEESKDNDRVSKKQLGLISTYLKDEKEREAALESEDSMELYLALWAYGFTDVSVAYQKIGELCTKGSRHQRLVALYYLYATEIPYSRHLVAKDVVRNFHEEQDVMAIAMRSFMGNVSNYLYDIVFVRDDSQSYIYAGRREKNPDPKAEISKYFKDREECLEFYELLQKMYDQIPKKGVEIAPCIFPWNKESLTRSDLLMRMAICASALEDEEKKDHIANSLSEIGSGSYNYDRVRVMELLLTRPKTENQWKALASAVADAETSTRGRAFELISKSDFPDYCYSILEDMLRLKKADVRENVIKLLSGLDEEKKKEMILRLLADKKEEKRTAGLDFVLQLKNAENDTAAYRECVECVKNMASPSTKEKVLIDEILCGGKEEYSQENGYGLYDADADYVPVFDEAFLKEGVDAFAEIFPESKIAGGKKKNSLFGKKNAGVKEETEILRKLDALIEENKNLEYPHWDGEMMLIGNSIQHYRNEAGDLVFPYEELWEDFYREKIGDPKMLLKLLLLKFASRSDSNGYHKNYEKVIGAVLGEGYLTVPDFTYGNQIFTILLHLSEQYREPHLLRTMGCALTDWLLREKQPFIYSWKEKRSWDNAEVEYNRSLTSHEQLREFFAFMQDAEEDFKQVFPFYYCLSGTGCLKKEVNSHYFYGEEKLGEPDTVSYLLACDQGLITKEFLYKSLLGKKRCLADTVGDISSLIKTVREEGRTIASRHREYRWQKSNLAKRVFGEEGPGKNETLTALINEIYDRVINRILEVELVRGDSPTAFSGVVSRVKRIYGIENFVKILKALGKETLERSTYYSYYYRSYDEESGLTKKQSLSHLLTVCVPEEQDTAGALKSLIKGTDIDDKRLIEAALYSPEWMDLVGEYLGWDGFMSGCYYFTAHMNESFDDKRTAMIAKYTPLSKEELNDGAFDLNWFREVYETLGEKRFGMIYQAAKYISDGTKHTRARKYADAARGKLASTEVRQTVEAKRNKDLLMAYALIPLEKKETYKEKYLFLQKFLKESKKFGAQRRASEKTAVDMAVKNLALTAGYTDEMRFILNMESEIASELIGYFEPHTVEEAELSLQLSEDGKLTVRCDKAGKTLKSVPAKLKKNEYVVALQEAKKVLTEQYRRTRQMLETSMEEEGVFTLGELRKLCISPVSELLVRKLLFKIGDVFGFMEEFDDLKKYPDQTEVMIAHPYHLYKAGVWREYQKKVFEKQLKQPFRQVFRELYVKTAEESNALHSLRYAGNQIQVKKTVACLKGRRWVCDAEDGLQKVFYKENIIASIYAMADWFAPSDIETPTLEWVVFTDRKNFREIRISEIPDVLFSEVMRDVDLAVSVAHAGGVDPEMSHSTIEMRRAIAEFTLPLLKLTNVTFTDSHALIKGTRANYTIQLGSGVVHQEGGPMINVLPVHSQHRGRIFLPFVDDDPKTAEIISKIVLFAEDGKIKDPFILEQIAES